MSNLGFRTIYRYFCDNEMKWVTEERAEGSTPVNCLNDGSHTIKQGSISFVKRIVNLKRIQQVNHYDTCNMENIDVYFITDKLEELAKRVRVLEEILQRENYIKFI